VADMHVFGTREVLLRLLSCCSVYLAYLATCRRCGESRTWRFHDELVPVDAHRLFCLSYQQMGAFSSMHELSEWILHFGGYIRLHNMRSMSRGSEMAVRYTVKFGEPKPYKSLYGNLKVMARCTAICTVNTLPPVMSQSISWLEDHSGVPFPTTVASMHCTLNQDGESEGAEDGILIE